ncbi:tripartite tricarboxylate transporter substrate-binding protein [Variovorax saccharolyticus]|uniref:tripartite tricarboxylate transporter substrate-binding protein n=1 Tax=Variovorax saccharolyticus TaxID=3053516 RepID=UPI0025769820|nr:tripartite tricarboxylate transporter substrate-binding protein [Variovorax sp. J22R187]MDM0017492.1 tripartite tricarboxylate transporter substrate-binding protein [Variovorax sp. J22R187]
MKLPSAFKTLLRLATASALAASAACAYADDAAVKIMVGSNAGSGTDVIARHLALGLQQELKRPFVVENRSGAGGQIAAQALKAARPDGLTLFLSNSHTVSMIPLTTLNPGFDALKDFAPVGLVAIHPDVFVVNPTTLGNPNAGLRDFATWAKANPGRGNVGVPAPASAPVFAVDIVSRVLGSDLKSVPYRGDAPMLQDLIAGQIPAGIGSVGAMLPPAKAGKTRIVAVNGTKRLPLLPDVPTYAELGIQGYEEVIFTSLFAPANTPPALLQSYSTALAKLVRSPEFTETLANMGVTAASSTPAELTARVKETNKAWTTMVSNVGYTPQ